MPDPQVLTSAIFAKTPLGQQEIQSRALGLQPLVRRILVLIDGKRSYADLAALVPEGSDVGPMIETLLDKGCVQVQGLASDQAQALVKAATAPAPVAVPSALGDAAPDAPSPATNGPAQAIPGLPAANARTAKENEMARHFMINSINAIIGQQMRISLIHDIFHAETTAKLREIYFAWEASMANHSMGAKRLPELREKLFKVL